MKINDTKLNTIADQVINEFQGKWNKELAIELLNTLICEIEINDEEEKSLDIWINDKKGAEYECR